MKISYLILSSVVILAPAIDRIGAQELTLSQEKRLKPLFRTIREFALNLIGRSGNEPMALQRAINLRHIQDRMPRSLEFPCSDYINPVKYRSNGSDSDTWSGPRSRERPSSVHALRPGDIDVVGALGDSLTAANGAAATNVFQAYVENRGLSWSIGGQGTWREYLTLPNLLKMFNPKLIGYSLSDSFGHHRETQFNAAEAGAMSRDLPHMAKELVKRMRNDPRVNMKEDWKLITIMIGANDFCINSCYQNNPMDTYERHRKDLRTALTTIRDNLPRTLVNLVPAPNVGILRKFTNKPFICELLHRFECPCFFGTAKRFGRSMIQKKLIPKWQQYDMEVANLPEFNDREDFTIIPQSFVMNISFPLDANGYTDYSHLSSDCFHFSQKGYARAANALWNNMLEPVGEKSLNWADVFETVRCPTKENPYIFTRKNSIKNNADSININVIDAN